MLAEISPGCWTTQSRSAARRGRREVCAICDITAERYSRAGRKPLPSFSCCTFSKAQRKMGPQGEGAKEVLVSELSIGDGAAYRWGCVTALPSMPTRKSIWFSSCSDESQAKISSPQPERIDFFNSTDSNRLTAKWTPGSSV